MSRLATIITRTFKVEQDISLALIPSPEMIRLNSLYRHKPVVTDVLSFRLASESADRLLGEILICRAVAQKQARGKRHSLQRELQILTIHGTLHLLGYDHVLASEAKVMERLERQVLAELTKS